MKEELVKLRQYANELKRVEKDFNFRRDVFNYEAEKKGLFTNVTIDDFGENEKSDAYECAKTFCSVEEHVVVDLEDLLMDNPDASEETIHNLLTETLKDSWYLDEDEAKHLASTCIGIFSLNFEEVEELEDRKEELQRKVKDYSYLLLEDTVDNVKTTGKKVGRAVGGVLKPYADVAKGQLTDASAKVKQKANKGINTGAKQLVKVLEKVADATDPNK